MIKSKGIFLTVRDFFRKYSFFPPILVLLTNLISSFPTRPLIPASRLHDIVTAWDLKIPFVPEFIHIYFLAFVQWAVCLIAVMLLDKRASWYYCIGMSIGNVIAGIIFLLFPTVMTIRPELTGSGFTYRLATMIFSADDPPLNLFPSIHCLLSWGCARMIFAVKRLPKTVKYINAVFSAAVFASVLFVKQHYVIDVPAGILAFEAGLVITKYSHIHEKLAAVESRILKEKDK